MKERYPSCTSCNNSLWFTFIPITQWDSLKPVTSITKLSTHIKLGASGNVTYILIHTMYICKKHNYFLLFIRKYVRVPNCVLDEEIDFLQYALARSLRKIIPIRQ